MEGIKDALGRVSAYIEDLEARLQKARLMYAEWQLNEKRMTKELLNQSDQIIALIEKLSEYIERSEIDKILSVKGEKHD